VKKLKLIRRRPKEDEEESITISVHRDNDKVLRIINILESPDELLVQLEQENFKLSISDIFYVDSVDFKTFVYAQSVVYQSKLRLYEMEETLPKSDFLRINRQTILNLRKIKSVASAGGGRIEVILTNEEKLIVSRQYAPNLKERFGL